MGRTITHMPDYAQPAQAKGRVYTYYRRGKHRQKIPGDFVILPSGRFKPSAVWLENYTRIHLSFEDAAANAGEQDRNTPPPFGSLAWLIDLYLGRPDRPNPVFEKLADITKRDYRKHLKILREEYGDKMWSGLTTKWLLRLRDKHQSTPRKADYFTTLFRILGKRAIQEGIRQDNPADAVELIYRAAGGYPPWSAYELAWFEASAIKPQIKLSYYLALYTGQREEDVLRMQWNDIKDDTIHAVQEKTGKKVWIPIHNDLAPVLLEAKKTRKGVFIVTKENGAPYTVEGWRTVWGRERAFCGLNHVKFHGLRKNASIALVEAGCSGELARSITGHETTQTFEIYTAEVRQKILAQQAIEIWNAARRERVEL